jgi:hypothetical protein
MWSQQLWIRYNHPHKLVSFPSFERLGSAWTSIRRRPMGESRNRWPDLLP